MNDAIVCQGGTCFLAINTNLHVVFHLNLFKQMSYVRLLKLAMSS